MNEMEEIVYTLRGSDNEGTESPYWLILDPHQNMNCNVHSMANDITGPFFSRKDAEEHLHNRPYAFSSRAVVYCNSGYWSYKYKNLCRTIEKNKGG